MTRPRRFTIEEKTFGFSLRVQVSGSTASAIAECERHCDLRATGNLTSVNGWVVVNGLQSFMYLYGWPEPKNDGSKGTLVHELVHVVRGLLKQVGCRDEETQANVTQYFYVKAHERLDKLQGNSRRSLCS